MKILAKIKQILSLNKDFFSKAKKYSPAPGGIKAKRFWLYAESLGEFRLALYIIDIIKSVLHAKEEYVPVFFISFKTRSTLSLIQKSVARGNGALYFFHPFFGLKFIFKKYAAAVRPDYFISVQHPVSKNLIKELLNINAKLIFSGISTKSLKKMGINYPEPSAPAFLSATVSGFSGAAPSPVKFNTLPLSLKFISCMCADDGNTAGYAAARTGNDIVVSFVSIHKKEAGFILNLARELISDASIKDLNKNLKFIFAPRNIKNSRRLFKEAFGMGLNPAYYDENTAGFLKSGGIKSLIVDKYGVLGGIYPVSDIVYVGKSLFEKEKGGHNILEPALYGKSIITGPYSSNFNDIIREMLKYDAITEVTEYNFKGVLTKLIKNEAARSETGKNALDFCLGKKDEFKAYFKNYLTENII